MFWNAKLNVLNKKSPLIFRGGKIPKYSSHKSLKYKLLLFLIINLSCFYIIIFFFILAVQTFHFNF